MNNAPKKEPILKVVHLKQFFKMGKSKLKAVNDISFEIYKGEVFGLVGESGCGKTTTGRAIIKLYDITSGNIYFLGEKISAGTRWNEKEIKFTNIRARHSIRQLKEELAEKMKNLAYDEQDELAEKIYESKEDTAYHLEISSKIKEEYNLKRMHLTDKYKQLITEIKDNAHSVTEEQRKQIREAHAVNRQKIGPFINRKLHQLKKEYEANIATASTDEELKIITKDYKIKCKIAKKTPIMSKMQMIFQDPIASLNPRMTVKEIIAEGLKIRGDHHNLEKRVYDVLEKVGLLPEHASRYPHEFSGGQRQRIGIARALIMEPDLIIADEPISALDVSIQAQIINLLNELRESLGLTILFIAHDLSVVKYFCNRIAVMYYGKIVEMASSEELFKNPLHPYTKSLLSAIPLPDPLYEKKRKRIKYNPNEHNYKNEKPELKEITDGHFIYCNSEEFENYKEEIRKKEADHK